MNRHGDVTEELAKGAGTLAVHVIAVVVGLVLMFVGVAMGVTIVMLPVGVPLGLVGLAVFGWGLFGWNEGRRASSPPRPR